MPLDLPEYISGSGILDAPIEFEWPEKNPEDVYTTPDERLAGRMAKTSQRGILALSAGTSEWIAWRFSGHAEILTILNLTEAMWATMIDWRYLKIGAMLDAREWRGQVRGPLKATFSLLVDVALHVFRDEASTPEAVCLSRLAQYVLPHERIFTDWRSQIITRLAKWYPPVEIGIGEPIPRIAIDPTVEYSADLAPAALHDFVRHLNPANNPYLRPTAEMKAKGFEGDPYPQ
jgi:hypothetical protein